MLMQARNVGTGNDQGRDGAADLGEAGVVSRPATRSWSQVLLSTLAKSKEHEAGSFEMCRLLLVACIYAMRQHDENGGPRDAIAAQAIDNR
jgi:hypothetical protein